MSKPTDDTESGPSKDFDRVWKGLDGPDAGKESNATGTKAWTEEVRARRKHDADGEPDATIGPAPSARTQAWTDEARGAAMRAAPQHDEEEMARLMSAPAAEVPDDDSEPIASASTSMASFTALGVEAPPVEKADDEMARLMGAKREAERAAEEAGWEDAIQDAESKAAADDTQVEDSSQANAKDAPSAESEAADASDDAEAKEEAASDGPEAEPVAEASADKETKSEATREESEAESEAKAANEGTSSEDELEPPIVLHPSRPKEKDEVEAEQAVAEASGGGNIMLWLAGAAAVVAVGYFAFGRTPQPKPTTVASSSAGAATAAATPADARDNSADEEALAKVREPDVAAPGEPLDPEPPPKPKPLDPNRPPREPPPGTPPEIAAVFKKLPVSPADRAPVGGVGKTGVHVDHIAMGSGYERSRCVGGSEAFSVGNDKLANVCLRVVHQREKEELAVVWQKVEGNARRGKIVVKPAHAYRTRAYLKLRSEYVGDWTVKILSADGVELAEHAFTVVP